MFLNVPILDTCGAFGIVSAALCWAHRWRSILSFVSFVSADSTALCSPLP